MSAATLNQSALLPNYDAIVVGSGIGGLAAAALLAKHARRRTLVLERHYVAGGYTHVFHRPGYEWDVGVHYIGQAHIASSPVRRAYDHITEGRLAWAPMPDVYDRILIDGRQYDFPSGRANLRRALLARFPAEARALDRYFAAVQSAVRTSALYFAEKAIPRPLAALAGPLLRYPHLRWAGRTTAEVLAQCTANRELIAVLTAQWPDYGLPPAESSFSAHATVADHYFEGAAYPVGGSARIAQSILPTIEAAGGQVVVAAEVAEVILESGRAAGVRLADGRTVRAPLVFSDAGAPNTLNRLLPAACPPVEPLRRALAAIPPSAAHIALYVGLKHSAAELGLDGTNLWIYPTPDHDLNVRRFAADPAAPLPCVFISFPSAKDPDFDRRHPNRATIEVASIVPYHPYKPWQHSRWKKRPAAYDTLKHDLARRLQAELERHVPAVRGRIDYAELSTPLSTRHFMNYPQGEVYGLAATPARYSLRALAPHTPIPGLFLTGQDAASSGVTGALFGAVAAASAALGRNLFSKATSPNPM